MGPEKLEKVLEKLATNSKVTIVIERQTELKCALRDQVLELRKVDERLHIARKPRQ